MPFQPMDFANIRPNNYTSPDYIKQFADSFTNLYNLTNLPAEKEKTELANALQRYKVQEEPAKFNAWQTQQPFINALKQAEAAEKNRSANDPFSHLPGGPARDVLARGLIEKQFGSNSKQMQDFDKAVSLQNQKDQSLVNSRFKYANSIDFRSLPPDSKRNVIALGKGMGYTEDETIKAMNNGQSMQQLADAKGLDLEKVEPSYAPTTPQITAAQNRKAFNAELVSLEHNMINPISQMGYKIGGVDPSLLWKQITNEKPDLQAKILAANALQPELALIRGKQLGATTGVKLAEKMQSAALGNLKVVESVVSPEVRTLMNKYISEWVTQASEAYTNSVVNGGKVKRNPGDKSGGKSYIGTVNGQKVRVSPENRRNFIEKYGIGAINE